MLPSERQPSAHGFLGSTSFAAVYLEDSNLKSLHDKPSNHQTAPEGWPQSAFQPNRESQVRKGAEWLSIFRNLPLFEPLLQDWTAQITLSMIVPWIPACLESVKTGLFNDLMKCPENVTTNLLLDYSTEIFKNSLKPLNVRRECSMHQYAELITRSNLRWDSIGMLFTAIGLAAVTVDDWAGGKLEYGSLEFRRQLSRQMLEAGDFCISVCEEIGQLTDPESWLLCENTHLSTLVEGDASYTTWRRVGDMVSIVVAKGLHGEIVVSSDVPFWLSELRKRTFAVAYCFDKDHASFMGRPPRLPRRYCSMQLPLDIDQNQLRLPEAQVEDAVNKLDQNGWNTEGSFRGTVFVRASMIRHMITEDMLEVTLSALPPPGGIAFIQELLQRLRQAWSSLPPFIRDYSIGKGNAAQKHLPELIRLEYQHNDFQLHRLMVQRFQWSNEELVRISREVLSAVLQMSHRHGAGAYAYDMPWITAKHALPTAGVLGLELLRQSQGHPVAATFNKSEVVQNLSALVSTLKTNISKQAVNYEICRQARPVLQRILDLVLDPQTSRSEVPSTSKGSQVDDGMSYEDSFLDQVKSEPEFWSLLPQHPLLADLT